ncbi:ribose 5-phosphate isomerase A [Pedobacter steynii]|uniref:Ribose 5-phosphate isomerase A n=1 Tax=Pedobacter steynii TaxID=430522 RepID=A0A1D7QML9_9SPHI|nr:ribose 5-phosphate isomerase A [Pedobacter steynii]AOM79910.1 ribose 5-phosphate isomerase A [Pedobacter steynii]
MADYKRVAAEACLQFLKPGQTIGVGAGSSISHLINFISLSPDLADHLIVVSSSFKTRALIQEKGLQLQVSAQLNQKLDIYFDGCDQFDEALNALKSGGGIHTSEKILASMAGDFILIGDDSKMVSKLDHTYPLVIEILPEALKAVTDRLKSVYPTASVKLRITDKKDGVVISDNGNLLADMFFEELPEISALNTNVKMIPGVVEHSLFYGMATKAIIAGAQGTVILNKKRE